MANLTFPLTILWPADLPVAVIGQQWSRDESDEIRAVYNDADELAWSVNLTAWIKEWHAERETESGQLSLFGRQQVHSYREGL